MIRLKTLLTIAAGLASLVVFFAGPFLLFGASAGAMLVMVWVLVRLANGLQALARLHNTIDKMPRHQVPKSQIIALRLATVAGCVFAGYLPQLTYLSRTAAEGLDVPFIRARVVVGNRPHRTLERIPAVIDVFIHYRDGRDDDDAPAGSPQPVLAGRRS